MSTCGKEHPAGGFVNRDYGFFVAVSGRTRAGEAVPAGNSARLSH